MSQSQADFRSDSIPALAKEPNVAHAIIEIPKGCRSKFEYDKQYGVFRLDRYLYSASHYPGDYGFVPRTLSEDRDPLDVLVMVSEPTFSGCLIEVRVLGMFSMLDHGLRDDKLLGVPDRDPIYATYQQLDDVPPHYLREVEHFFTTYKQLEGGTIQPGEWHARDEAIAELHAASERYSAVPVE